MEHDFLDTYQTFIKLYNHACIHSSIIIKKLKGDVYTIIIRLKKQWHGPTHHTRF